MDNTTVAEEGQVKNKIVVVKKERADEEIKEFAETAMNELLGWYGYGPNHSKDIMQQRTANSCKSRSNSNSSGPDSPKFTEGCGWCGKVVDDSNGLSSGSSTFCSELCFSQSRRANFKKNKTCDWCRHVRHTVSYVDFQDGASQLQFCSDKCLNQYKMHIFCRETRAHLEMHPHLIGEDSTTAGLITPDLWLKNCKTPPLSVPMTTTIGAPTSRTPSPVCCDEQTSPLPLITVAHPSKLLASPPDRIRSPRVKRSRKRQPSTATKVSESPQDLRIRHSPVPDPPHVYPAHPPQQPHPSVPDHHHYYHHQLPSFPPHPMLMRPTNSVLPPVTVMVPYPVAVPIPIPIPIPLPLSSFLKAADIKNKLLQEAAATAAAVAAATAASQNTADESSQNTTAPVEDEPEAEQETEDTKEDEIVVDDVKTSPTRPVRKRKRVVEAKAKTVLKSKKPLSV